MLIAFGLLVLLVLGSTTFVHIRTLKHDYLEALEWRAEALSQGILNDIIKWGGDMSPRKIQSALRGSAFLCKSTYEQNKEQWITHIAIVDEQGVLAVHNDRDLQGSPVESRLLLEELHQHERKIVLDRDSYHSLIPIFNSQQIYMGTIDVGIDRTLVDTKIRQMLWQALALFGVFLVLSVIVSSVFTQVLLTAPMQQLVSTGKEFARGHPVSLDSFSRRKDELGVLGGVFTHIGHYLQGVAVIASHIATGSLNDSVEVRSEHDALGKACMDMMAYLRQVAEMMARIAQGDLRFSMAPRSPHDAFGHAIQLMTDGLKNFIRQIRESSDQIAATGEEIASLSQHDSRIARNVTESVENMVSTMHQMGSSVEEVTGNMEGLSSSVEETSSSISQMTTSIKHIASNADALTGQTEQTIASLQGTLNSLEDVVDNIDKSQLLAKETTQNAFEGQQAVELVTGSMQTIDESVTTAVEAITQFSQRSQDIDSILDVIRDITEQTSLLALNASIIAAQAGSHGRGFAVVADEIKGLATGVGTSTKNIAAIVQSLKQDTNHVVQTIHTGASSVEQGIKQTQQARQALEKILESANQSSTLVNNIADTLHALVSTSRQVSDAMQEVKLMTDDITRATNEQKTTTAQIEQAISQINDMAAQIHLSTNEQTRGVHQLLVMAEDVMEVILQNQASSQHITQRSELLSSQAELLLHAVERFTLDDEER